MNFLFASEEENVEKKQIGTNSCYYCKKVFKNYHAFEAHLRAHQNEINSMRSLDCSSVCPSNFIDQKRLSSPILLSETDIGYDQNQFMIPPSFYFGNGISSTQNPNFLFPAGSSSSINNMVQAGFSSDTSLSPGPDEICELNTDRFSNFRDLMSNPATNAYNFNNQTNHSPNFISNHLFGFNKPTTYSSLQPSTLGQCSNQVYDDQRRKNTVLESDGGVKRCLLGDQWNTELLNGSKRTKTNSRSPLKREQPEKKELLLFKDVGNSFSALGFPTDAKEENHSDLDLSLHL